MIKQLQAEAAHLDVLYAEDEPSARELLHSLLRKFFRSVDAVANGEEALERIEKGSKRYHILLTDLAMPEMDGLELIRRIREREEKIHVLIISAHSDTHNLLKAVELGVEYFLIKPVENERLYHVLLRMVRRINQAAELERLRTCELKEKRDRAERLSLGALLESMPLPMLLTDRQGRVLCRNGGFDRLMDPFIPEEARLLSLAKEEKLTLGELDGLAPGADDVEVRFSSWGVPTRFRIRQTPFGDDRLLVSLNELCFLDKAP